MSQHQWFRSSQIPGQNTRKRQREPQPLESVFVEHTLPPLHEKLDAIRIYMKTLRDLPLEERLAYTGSGIMVSFMMRIKFDLDGSTSLQMIKFTLPTNGDRALSDQDDGELMKAATWLHSAIAPLSDLSLDTVDENGEEMDTGADDPVSMNGLFHYITEKDKRPAPRFLYAYATGSLEYGADKSIQNPLEKATIMATYVASDIIERCFEPNKVGMSTKVLTRLWDHGSETAKREAFTTVRIVCSRKFGVSAMAKEVKTERL